jgi:hypothetical protein
MSEPKIQGTLESCIQKAQYYSNLYKVNYNLYFNGKFETIVKSPSYTDITKSLFFSWRFEYKEYDNSY